MAVTEEKKQSNTILYALILLVLAMGGNTIYSEVSELDDNKKLNNQLQSLQSQITVIKDKPLPQVIQGIDGLRGEKGEPGEQGSPGKDTPQITEHTHPKTDTRNLQEEIDDVRADHNRDDNKIRDILDDITTDYEEFFDEISDTIKKFTKIFDNIQSHQDTQDNRIDTNQQDITQLREEMNAEFEAIKEEYDW